MGRSQQKGARFEQMCADYITGNSDLKVIRKRLHGAKDEGDLFGLSIAGEESVVECKDCKKMELAQWVDESEVEMHNANAKYAIVIHHRKGKGAKNFGDNYVTMTLDMLLKIIQNN